MYSDYLHGTHWKEFKENYRSTFNVKGCSFCSSDRGLHFHHVNYERLGREEFSDVIPLCGKCHAHVHHIADDFPYRSLEWATNKARERVQKRLAVHPTKRRKRRKGFQKRECLDCGRRKATRGRRYCYGCHQDWLSSSKQEVIGDGYLARDIDAQFRFVTAGI